MNKVNILSIVFAGICAFSACTDDKDPVINDLKDSEGNNISFTLMPSLHFQGKFHIAYCLSIIYSLFYKLFQLDTK